MITDSAELHMKEVRKDGSSHQDFNRTLREQLRTVWAANRLNHCHEIWMSKPRGYSIRNPRDSRVSLHVNPNPIAGVEDDGVELFHPPRHGLQRFHLLKSHSDYNPTIEVLRRIKPRHDPIANWEYH